MIVDTTVELISMDILNLVVVKERVSTTKGNRPHYYSNSNKGMLESSLNSSIYNESAKYSLRIYIHM